MSDFAVITAQFVEITAAFINLFVFIFKSRGGNQQKNKSIFHTHTHNTTEPPNTLKSADSVGSTRDQKACPFRSTVRFLNRLELSNYFATHAGLLARVEYLESPELPGKIWNDDAISTERNGPKRTESRVTRVRKQTAKRVPRKKEETGEFGTYTRFIVGIL